MMNLLCRHLPTLFVVLVVLSACVTTSPARSLTLNYNANTTDPDVIGVAEVQTENGWQLIETTPVEPSLEDRTHALRTGDLPPGTYTLRVWNLRVTDQQRSEQPTNEVSTTILPAPVNPAGLIITQLTIEILPDGTLHVLSCYET